MQNLTLDPQLDALLQALYAGPLEEKPWQQFLELFRQVLGAKHATLLLRPPSEGDSGVVLNAVVTSHDVYESYNDKYFALDPFVDLPNGKVVTLQEFVDREKLIVSEYYQQYIGTIDVFHIMGVDMTSGGGLHARLRLTRSEKDGDFGEREKLLCQILVPHIEQAIAIYGRLKNAETESAAYADAIDQLAMGSIILDGSARVLRINSAAEQLLDQHPQINVLQGQLRLGNSQQNQAFRQLIDEVLAAHRQSTPGFVRAFRMGTRDSSNGLGLLIRPLPLVASARDPSQPSVVIFISDPQQKRNAPATVLADLFGFTPAESALALLLANGLTLDQAASELGVSRNTAKSHLSAIFSKTGLTRQAKLVELILKSVAPLGASGNLELS